MDLNLKSLKRLDSNEFTLIPTSKDHVNRNLCNHCANKGCVIPAVQSSYPGCTMETVKCELFIPPIGFQSRHGLLKGKNTMRLGKAWAERVQKGDKLGLIDASTGQMFGTATVWKSLCGTPQEMLHNHSSKNHLFAGQRITKAKASEEMALLMPQIYGNMYWQAAKSISVIVFDSVEIFGG